MGKVIFPPQWNGWRFALVDKVLKATKNANFPWDRTFNEAEVAPERPRCEVLDITPYLSRAREAPNKEQP